MRLPGRMGFSEGSGVTEVTYPGHLRSILRTCRERPRCRCAAEQRYELAAPHHSITSSARASSVGGISRPSAFAVLRLITSSNFVGCSIGNSEAFSPLKPDHRDRRLL